MKTHSVLPRRVALLAGAAVLAWGLVASAAETRGRLKGVVYDEQGQQMSADFEHYKLATAADVPDIEITYAPTPCPHTPLGTRGIGEGRPSSVPGALSNAVCDALRPWGIEITDLPLRPGSVWQKLRETRG